MKKTQTFRDVQLSALGIKELDGWLTAPGGILDDYHVPDFVLHYPDGAEWKLDTFQEFLADYHPSLGAYYQRGRGRLDVEIVNSADNAGRYVKVTVHAPDKAVIQAVFSIIERNLVEACTVSQWNGEKQWDAEGMVN